MHSIYRFVVSAILNINTIYVFFEGNCEWMSLIICDCLRSFQRGFKAELFKNALDVCKRTFEIELSEEY